MKGSSAQFGLAHSSPGFLQRKEPDKLPEALAAASELVREQLDLAR